MAKGRLPLRAEFRLWCIPLAFLSTGNRHYFREARLPALFFRVELKSAQDIVNEIQAKQNPKSNEQKPEQLLANNNQDNLEQKDNTVIKEQTMDDIINNAKQEQSANMPKDELQDFINKITE